MSIRISALLLCACALLGQDKKPAAEQAPPEVDAALRARITQFYQAHVDGKFRVADQVVAEEAKDAFFEMQKAKILGFEISSIKYTDGVTKAEASVLCDDEWTWRGTVMKRRYPRTSYWKLIGGQWFWYVPPVTTVATPFGAVQASQGDAKDAAPKSPFPANPAAAAESILGAVKVDKRELTLSATKKSSGVVIVNNGMPGEVSIEVGMPVKVPGLSFTVDNPSIRAKSTARVQFTYEPDGTKPVSPATAQIVVSPINKTFVVRIVFAPALPAGSER